MDFTSIKSILEIHNLEILSDISMSHDPQHPLYPVRFTKGNLAGTPAVLKILTKQQASLYQHLVSIENPHLEKIYEVGFQDDLFYSINEYVFRPDFYNYKLYDAYYKTNVKSLTLLEYIKNYEMFEKPSDSIHFIPERTALRLLLDLINGLEAMQASGLVHGDLSPQNILLYSRVNENDARTSKNVIPFSLKIIDFGTLRPIRSDEHPVTQVMGTKEFSAPELLAYNIPNDRMDIYSLGCLLHYMCLGIAPSEKGLDQAKTFLSSGVYQIIKNCNNEYSSRYQSLKSLRKAVERELRIPADTSERFLSKLPGFRTGRLWKKIIASIYYLWLISYIATNIIFGTYDCETILVTLLFIAWVVFVCDYFRIGDRVMWYKNLTKQYPVFRVFAKIGIFILVYVIYYILWQLIKN